MTEADGSGTQKPSSRYENILRNTLMKRTGKAFQRNIGSAPVPRQETQISHDEVANQIFDNILKRSRENKQAASAPSEESREQTYEDILDDILLGDEESESALAGQTTLAENNPLPETHNPYQQVLKKTLNKNLKALVVALEAQEAEMEAQMVNQDYSAALDEVLGLEAEDGFAPEPENAKSLSRTRYHQHLDEILWPSEEDEATEAHAPVNEDKIRSVVAEYLQELILPEPYGLISVQRQVLDEKYTRYWIVTALEELGLALRELETEFTVWVFLNHLDLIKPLLTQEFVERFRLVIEHMLPQKKNEKLFVRTLQNQEQRLVFDKMISSKFEDVRRILRYYHKQFNDDDAFHLYNFFRIKLPEFLEAQRSELMQVLRQQSEAAASNPFIGSFLSHLFFSEAFAQRFQTLQEDEKNYQKAFLNFLRERAEFVGESEDRLLPVTLLCMDLYHEKALFFKPSERETLGQALDILDKLLRFVPDASLDKETFLVAFSTLVEKRVQSQYHVENRAVQGLAQEIGQLSYQTDQASRIRLNHLNAMYERHYQELNDTYHKRRDTLEKINQVEGPGGTKRSRKQFVLRKIKACQQYLQRRQRKQNQAIQIAYREYAQAFLDEKKETLTASQEWDNDYERQVLENVFQKANIVLKAMNESKSTVQFNLKLLFDGDPQQDLFLQCFHELGQHLWGSLEALEGHKSLAYVLPVLQPYLEGLRYPEFSEPLTLNRHEQIGYIIAYLGHVSHIKLLLNRQFRQVIFDFKTLFGLAHALYVFDFLVQQPQLSFEEHYRQALDLAWNCLISHCLLVGKGQYHFIANPLALHDYSWQPPLTGFGIRPLVGAETDDDFDLIEMQAPAQIEGRKKSRFALPASESEQPVAPRRRALPAAGDETSPSRRPALPPAASASETSERPALPAASRRLPVAPGKFELYSAPNRRTTPPIVNSSFSIEEDDFYKIMGQTQVGATPKEAASAPPAASPPATPSGPDEEESFDLLSFGEDEADQHKTQVFQRPRGADEGQATPGSSEAAESTARERKRWLEITPVPQDNQNYNQMLDSILNTWDEEEQAESGHSANTARRILKPHQQEPRQQSSSEPPADAGDMLIYKRKSRRRFDFDD